jgi:hypothetical protein
VEDRVAGLGPLELKFQKWGFVPRRFTVSVSAIRKLLSIGNVLSDGDPSVVNSDNQ